MKQYERARRVGLASLAVALVLRLYMMDLPGKFPGRMPEQQTDALATYSETGQNVRFSPSLGTFSPDFVESPPAAALPAAEPALPAFSGEETVEITWFVRKNADIPSLLRKELNWQLRGEKPTVLILHTHATESYTKKGEPYKESSQWRTLDEDYNMLSIGERVAELLEQAGIRTVRDRKLHDYPSYNGSYTDARKTLREMLKENPGIRLILDLHRDASGAEGKQLRTLARVDGEDSAQLMVVLGTNHKGYEENLALGLKLHALLEAQTPGIMRPLQLRAQRFNQDLCPGALLIEVGAAGNSHAEAMKAAEMLAQAVIALAEGTA